MDDNDRIVIRRRSSKKIVPAQQGSGAMGGQLEYANFAHPAAEQLAIRNLYTLGT
jgi:hypothetical protein